MKKTPNTQEASSACDRPPRVPTDRMMATGPGRGKDEAHQAVGDVGQAKIREDLTQARVLHGRSFRVGWHDWSFDFGEVLEHLRP